MSPHLYKKRKGGPATYNYVNQPQATTDAAGNTFSKAYNAAGEVTALQSSKTGTNYPQYLQNNISYNAFGEVVSATYGDGIVRTNTYDKMGRPTEIQDGTTSSPTYRLYLTYYGNGSVKTFNDTVSGAYTFTYDAFNRLVSSTNSAQTYSSTYDQFGNRWHQDKTAGTGYTVDLSFNNSNRITTSGYSYDAAGNLLKDASACNPCWQYDDNGNLVSSSYGSSAASYSYDALGRRVEKVFRGTTYDFVLDGSNPLDEYQGSSWPTTWSRTTGGVFTYANGTTYFNRTDDLGTPRLSTDYTGAVKRTETMGPFGDGFTESFAGLDFTGFAGGVWDQENNGDHFGAREYSKTQGRWLTPDPAGLAAVDPSNPQTWNRYAYVTNNPVSDTDPAGLCPDSEDCTGGNPGSGCNWFFGCGFPGSGGGQGSSPPPSNQAAPPWQEWGSLPPWLTSGAPNFGLPCDLGYCGPQMTDPFVSTGLPGNPLYKMYPWLFTNPFFDFDPGPPTLMRGHPSPTPTATVRALHPESFNHAKGECTIDSLNDNNSQGIPTGAPSGTDSVPTGNVMSQRTQVGDRDLNPSASNVVALNVFAAPGFFVQDSYNRCMTRHGF